MCISHSFAHDFASFNPPNFYKGILFTKLCAKGTLGTQTWVRGGPCPQGDDRKMQRNDLNLPAASAVKEIFTECVGCKTVVCVRSTRASRQKKYGSWEEWDDFQEVRNESSMYKLTVIGNSPFRSLQHSVWLGHSLVFLPSSYF